MVLMAEQMCNQTLANGLASFGILGNDWKIVTFLALFCSLLALVLANMLANFIRNQTLIAWTKFELFQVVGTATIFIFCVAWIAGMCSFDMGLLDEQYAGRNMYEIVDSYFQFLKGVGNALFGMMMYTSKVITLLQKMTYYSSPYGLGMTDNPLDSLGQLNSVLFFAVGGYVTSYMMLDLQFKIMEYMSYATLHFLLPFGIFFRAFAPTRGFGGALIGISFAFFLFYPITVVFNDYIVRTSANEVETELNSQVAKATADTTAGNTPTETPISLKSTEFGDANALGTMTYGLDSATIFLLKPLSLYLIAAVVLPVINFIILVEITKGLTGLLGDEVDITNLTRMI